MPKLPSLSAKRLVKLLEAHGFEYARAKGSHRTYYNELTGVCVVVPYHGGDLPKGTLHSILKDAGIEM